MIIYPDKEVLRSKKDNSDWYCPKDSKRIEIKLEGNDYTNGNLSVLIANSPPKPNFTRLPQFINMAIFILSDSTYCFKFSYKINSIRQQFNDINFFLFQVNNMETHFGK